MIRRRRPPFSLTQAKTVHQGLEGMRKPRQKTEGEGGNGERNTAFLLTQNTEKMAPFGSNLFIFVGNK